MSDDEPIGLTMHPGQRTELVATKWGLYERIVNYGDRSRVIHLTRADIKRFERFEEMPVDEQERRAVPTERFEP